MKAEGQLVTQGEELDWSLRGLVVYHRGEEGTRALISSYPALPPGESGGLHPCLLTRLLVCLPVDLPECLPA